MLITSVSGKKLLGIVLLVILAVILLAVFLSGANTQTGSAPVAVSASQDIRSNEDRVSFLNSFGWQVSEEPVRTQEVRIPTEPSEVFKRYNDLQISQGYNLNDYAGKTVMRYVYEVENYPNSDEDFFATLLIYNNTVIGGDVCSAAKGGIMQGFEMPE